MKITIPYPHKNAVAARAPSTASDSPTPFKQHSTPMAKSKAKWYKYFLYNGVFVGQPQTKNYSTIRSSFLECESDFFFYPES